LITKTRHPYTFNDGSVSIRGLSCGGVTVILAKRVTDTVWENTTYIHTSKTDMRVPITVDMPAEDAFHEITRHIERATFVLEDWVDPDLFDDKPRAETEDWGAF